MLHYYYDVIVSYFLNGSGNENHMNKTMVENEDLKTLTTGDASFTPPHPAGNATAKKTTPACVVS